MLHDLLVAVALLLVIEGILPFASPELFRRTIHTVAGMDAASLRWGGLVSMALGVGLLYLVN
ncbi:MAG: DUF2065 domain-containing protein [Chromatiales bacterium]|jgi:uncharacterized protein YjeT (DUF2065 family)